MKCQPLDLLWFHVGHLVIPVEDNIALVDLLHKEFLPPVRWHLVEAREFFQVSLSLIRDIESGGMLSLWCSDAFSNVFRG